RQATHPGGPPNQPGRTLPGGAPTPAPPAGRPPACPSRQAAEGATHPPRRRQPAAPRDPPPPATPPPRPAASPPPPALSPHTSEAWPREFYRRPATTSGARSGTTAM